MKKTNNFVKRFLSLLVVIVMIAAVLPTAAFASTVTKWNGTRYERRGGEAISTVYNVVIGDKAAVRYASDDWNWNGGAFQHNEGATYSIEIQDPSVISITIEDHPDKREVGMKIVRINGLKLGKSGYEVRENLNGKSSIIMRNEAHVLDSYLTATYNMKHEYGLGRSFTGLMIVNQKVDAKYTFSVDKPGLEVSITGSTDTSSEYKDIMCIAKEYGDYKLSITETLNGVSKTFQTVSMHVYPMTLASTHTVEIGRSFTPENDLLSYVDKNYDYFVECEDYDLYLYKNGHTISSPFAEAVENWNDYHPGMLYPVERCFLYVYRSGVLARLEGTVDVKTYRQKYLNGTTDVDPLAKPEYVGTTTVTVVPAVPE